MTDNKKFLLIILAFAAIIAAAVTFILWTFMPRDVLVTYNTGGGGIFSQSKTHYEYICAPLRFKKGAEVKDESIYAEHNPTQEEFAELRALEPNFYAVAAFFKIGDNIYYMKGVDPYSFYKFSIVDKSITAIPIDSINERLYHHRYGDKSGREALAFGVFDNFPGMDDEMVKCYDNIKSSDLLTTANAMTSGGRAFFSIGGRLYEYLPENQSVRHLGNFPGPPTVMWAKPK